MGLKMLNSGKNFLHGSFNLLPPGVSFLYLLKKCSLMFSRGLKREHVGNGLIAYGNYFFESTCLSFWNLLKCEFSDQLKVHCNITSYYGGTSWKLNFDPFQM